MKNFKDEPTETRIIAFNQISQEMGLPPYAVEKDWWVVQALSVIFSLEIGENLVFKGGTSLSKAWNIIERFSEDIDLAVDRSFFGFEGVLSKNQRTKLRKRASSYLTDTFFNDIQAEFKNRGFTHLDFKIVEAKSSDQDPRIIEIYYPNLIETPSYIKPKIQIEIGVRSLREPFTVREISTLVKESYSNIFDELPIQIPCVNPERTLIEKLFLLHEEFQRPKEKIRVNRLSRHLYDIYQLSNTAFYQTAFANQNLYETIINHRYIYTKLGGVDYNLHHPRTLRPLPPKELDSKWKSDYQTMQEHMIYGESPSYSDLINHLNQTLSNIHQLNWQLDCIFPTIK